MYIYIVFDIFYRDTNLITHLKLNLIELLNYMHLKGLTNISIYAIHSDCYKCIFVAKDRPPLPSVYIPLINDYKLWEEPMIDDISTLSAVRVCIKHLMMAEQDCLIFCICNCLEKWQNYQLEPRVKLFKIGEDKIDGFNCIQSSPIEVKNLFRNILNTFASTIFQGNFVLSQEGDQASHEIPIQLAPQHILTNKTTDVQNIEFFAENIVYAESISLAYIYGSSWIISSISGELAELCEYLRNEDLTFICSSIFDIDTQCMSFLPCYYALFPGQDLSSSFLVKKILTQEQICPINFPNMNIIENQSRLVGFVKTRFFPSPYTPYMIDGGLHQYLTSKALQGKEGPLPIPQMPNSTPKFGISILQGGEKSKRTTKRALEGIANSLRKKKKC